MNPNIVSYTTNVAGITFEDRQKLLLKCDTGELVDLVPEPANENDKNACKVVAGDRHIGYLDADVAKEFARRKKISLIKYQSFLSDIRWFDDAEIWIAEITVVEWLDGVDETEVKTLIEKSRNQAISRGQLAARSQAVSRSRVKELSQIRAANPPDKPTLTRGSKNLLIGISGLLVLIGLIIGLGFLRK